MNEIYNYINKKKLSAVLETIENAQAYQMNVILKENTMK